MEQRDREINISHNPVDYMEEEMKTAKLISDAAFKKKTKKDDRIFMSSKNQGTVGKQYTETSDIDTEWEKEIVLRAGLTTLDNFTSEKNKNKQNDVYYKEFQRNDHVQHSLNKKQEIGVTFNDIKKLVNTTLELLNQSIEDNTIKEQKLQYEKDQLTKQRMKLQKKMDVGHPLTLLMQVKIL
jgi:hypothetical protein